MTGDVDAYDNRTGRPPGRAVRALSRVLRGVASVQAQVEPYADAWRARNRDALASPTPERRLVVLGDSMMQGVGASRYDAGLVDQLTARLRGRGHPLTVVNLSATGARVSDVVEQQVPVLRALPGSSSGEDLVLVLVGSNDLFGAGAVRRALPEAMRRLVESLPQGAIVCTLPQPRGAARAANVHLEEAARRGRLRLVDLRVAGPTSWRGRLAADFFHPNDAGYAAMADAFEPVLLAALEEEADQPRE